MPSFLLIRQSVWPQYTNVTDRTGQTDRQTDRTDRQRSNSIGRTVLQTVAQKRITIFYRWFSNSKLMKDWYFGSFTIGPISKYRLFIPDQLLPLIFSTFGDKKSKHSSIFSVKIPNYNLVLDLSLDIGLMLILGVMTIITASGSALVSASLLALACLWPSSCGSQSFSLIAIGPGPVP